MWSSANSQPSSSVCLYLGTGWHPGVHVASSACRALSARFAGGAGRGRPTSSSIFPFFRKDVPMECRYADEFITLANAHELRLIVLF
jgi:hypothetical protein